MLICIFGIGLCHKQKLKGILIGILGELFITVLDGILFFLLTSFGITMNPEYHIQQLIFSLISLLILIVCEFYQKKKQVQKSIRVKDQIAMLVFILLFICMILGLKVWDNDIFADAKPYWFFTMEDRNLYFIDCYTGESIMQ